ncbi:MAG: hypothetical protein AAB636_00300 [Patescibacteria group bacterium]
MKNNIKKNNGFVILFSIILVSIILSIALGVGSIALQEVNFSTSSKNSNEAFFAADLGVECALFNDSQDKFLIDGSSVGKKISCAGNDDITIEYLGSSSYKFVIPNLGNSSKKNCVKVQISKGASLTSISSKGYNTGDDNCESLSIRRTEQALKVEYDIF